jgi:hypothetical protein
MIDGVDRRYALLGPLQGYDGDLLGALMIMDNQSSSSSE